MTSEIFVIAIKLASPILISLLFATSALGILSRAVPQINSFTLKMKETNSSSVLYNAVIRYFRSK